MSSLHDDNVKLFLSLFQFVECTLYPPCTRTVARRKRGEEKVHGEETVQLPTSDFSAKLLLFFCFVKGKRCFLFFWRNNV